MIVARFPDDVPVVAVADAIAAADYEAAREQLAGDPAAAFAYADATLPADVAEFNAALDACPIVFADETLPTRALPDLETDEAESLDVDEPAGLVTVQTITALEPIAGKDRILLARVLGYDTMVRVGEFAVGDLCAYHEPGLVVPAESTGPYTFLESRGHRIGVLKMAGVKSWGLALRVDALGLRDDVVANMKPGDDLTPFLGVRKYVPKSERAGGSNGLGKVRRAATFPTHLIPRTEEDRLQKIPSVLEKIRGREFVASVKVDGSSMTVVRDPAAAGSVLVCSRNHVLVEPNEAEGEKGNAYWTAARTFKIVEALIEEDRAYAIQGEVYGPAIQCNRLAATALSFAAYNVFDVEARRYLNQVEFHGFCVKHAIPTVPIVRQGIAGNRMDVAAFLEMSRGEYPGGHPREGIVVRLVDDPDPMPGKRVSFKVINPDFEFKVTA